LLQSSSFSVVLRNYQYRSPETAGANWFTAHKQFDTLSAMNRILLGIVLGLAAGVVDVLLMLPLKMPDKPTAMAGAFFSRFAIGFLVATVRLPIHPALAGALVGLLISIPDAIITKAYAPILIIGVILGALCGLAVKVWAV